jgi:hypothetical protein
MIIMKNILMNLLFTSRINLEKVSNYNQEDEINAIDSFIEAFKKYKEIEKDNNEKEKQK